MKLLEATTDDPSTQKHVPYITREGDKVKVRVGKEAAHPMTEEHYIVYIAIVADGVYMRKDLKPGDAPEAEFITSAKNIVAYEYCNQHLLWKSQ